MARSKPENTKMRNRVYEVRVREVLEYSMTLDAGVAMSAAQAGEIARKQVEAGNGGKGTRVRVTAYPEWIDTVEDDDE